MNVVSSITDSISNDGAKETYNLATHSTVKNCIYNFACSKDNTTAQLVVSKKETDNQTYSVFIKFIGIVNKRREWELSINKDDKVEMPWDRIVRYTGSRSFSFKIVDGNYVKITEYDENTFGVGYIDLLSTHHTLMKSLPTPAIQNLIRLARIFPTVDYKEVFFNESVVVMTIGSGNSWKDYTVYVGDAISLELAKCSVMRYNGAQGMLGIGVEFKDKTHILEILPLLTTANVSEKNICWDRNRLYGV